MSRGFSPRQTTARRLIAEALIRSRLPLTAAEALASVRRKRPVHKTTVYRNLEAMVRTGVATAVTLNDGVVRYETTAKPHHHHLVCTGCRRVEDVAVDETTLGKVQRQLGRRTRFDIHSHSLEFFGLCYGCQR